jgi:pyridoxal/pyridoxine/pyridoxamine kinase
MRIQSHFSHGLPGLRAAAFHIDAFKGRFCCKPAHVLGNNSYSPDVRFPGTAPEIPFQQRINHINVDVRREYFFDYL